MQSSGMTHDFRPSDRPIRILIKSRKIELNTLERKIQLRNQVSHIDDESIAERATKAL